MHALCEQESSNNAALSGMECRSVKTFPIVSKYKKFIYRIQLAKKMHFCTHDSGNADRTRAAAIFKNARMVGKIHYKP